MLITLDEVHTAALEDLRIITHAVQHAFREDRMLPSLPRDCRSPSKTSSTMTS